MPTSIKQYRQWRKETERRLGGKCANCGSIKKLEFDHIDPATKLFTVTKIWGIADKVLLEAEINKCQLLCYLCHRVKSSAECAARFTKDRTKCHGTLSQYYRYKCRCKKCIAHYSRYRKERYRKYKLARVAQLA